MREVSRVWYTLGGRDPCSLQFIINRLRISVFLNNFALIKQFYASHKIITNIFLDYIVKILYYLFLQSDIARNVYIYIYIYTFLLLKISESLSIHFRDLDIMCIIYHVIHLITVICCRSIATKVCCCEYRVWWHRQPWYVAHPLVRGSTV